MALNSRKVRLPELPIFRKFSLALRQEFARAEDVLAALEESRRQIKALTGEGPGRVRPGLAPSRREDPPEAQGPTPGEHDIDEDSPAALLKGSFVEPSNESTPESPKAEAAPGVKKQRTAESPKADVAPGVKKQRTAESPKADAAPGAKRPRSKKASPESPPAAPSVDTQTPAGGSSEDVETDFWGDERPWGKGRRGKPDKGRPGRMGIVRVGSEGRPVKDAEDSADEGG